VVATSPCSLAVLIPYDSANGRGAKNVEEVQRTLNDCIRCDLRVEGKEVDYCEEREGTYIQTRANRFNRPFRPDGAAKEWASR
jgi:hypothetical protein